MLRSLIVLCASLRRSVANKDIPAAFVRYPPISELPQTVASYFRRRSRSLQSRDTPQFSSVFSSACFCAKCGGYRNWYGTCCSHPRSSETMEDRVRGMSPSSRLLAPCRSTCARKPIARRPEGSGPISSLIPTRTPAWCSSSQRRRLIPTSMPNAAMILNVARIGTGKLHNRPLISRDAHSRWAECFRATGIKPRSAQGATAGAGKAPRRSTASGASK